QGHMECLRTGIAYVVASVHPDLPSTPLFTAESPKAFYAHLDVRTGKPEWAIRLYCTSPSKTVTSSRDYDAMTVYEPNWTRYYRRSGPYVICESGTNLRDLKHNMGEPPVEALFNHRSKHTLNGVPEHKALRRFQDAGARNLTTIQIAQELAAIPQKV